MGDGAADQHENDQLEKILGSVAESIAGSLKELVGRDLIVRPGKLVQTSSDQLLSDMAAQQALIVGELAADYAGEALHFLMPSPEAATLAGLLQTSPDDIIDEHRKAGVLDEDELDALAKVAETVCGSVEALLREHVPGEVGVQAGERRVLQPGGEAAEPLGAVGDLLQFSFPCTIEGYPESEVTILVQPQTAEKLFGAGLTGPRPADPLAEDELDDIPAAEIRGRLATYLVDRRHLMSVRKACRRVGLELSQHPATEVPNPAAHRDDIVLIEVPENDSRRFEWCRRLKSFRGDTKVVLLLRLPTRAQVAAGFMAKADAILGVPVCERQISQKLTALLDSADESTGEDAPATEGAGPDDGSGAGEDKA